MSDKLTVLTVATGNDGYLPILKDQLEKGGVNYKIIGYGEKWGGWTWRTNKMMKYIRDNHDPDDVIMVVDGYDILFVGDEQSVMKKYRSFDTEVVFGVGLNDSIDYSYLAHYVTFPIERSYFKAEDRYMKNGGSYMGTARSLLKLYRRLKKFCKKTGNKDDQLALNNMSLNGIPHKLDTKGEIFWIWHPNGPSEFMSMLINGQYPGIVEGFEMKDERPEFPNGVKPEVIHGIGHRDMSVVIGTDFKCRHRAIVQGDLYYTLYLVKALIIILPLLLFYLFYYRRSNKTVSSE